MQPIRVLVVDDEKDFASAVVERLARRGFTASAAFGGKEAVGTVRNSEFDVIVLDLLMPEMNGTEVCREIRAFSQVPILVLSAVSKPGITQTSPPASR